MKEPKYKVGDVVWFIGANNMLCSRAIQAVYITKHGEIKYLLRDGVISSSSCVVKNSDNIFLTATEAYEYLQANLDKKS